MRWGGVLPGQMLSDIGDGGIHEFPRLERVAVELVPFIAVEVLLLVVILLVPPLTGLIPRLAGFG